MKNTIRLSDKSEFIAIDFFRLICAFGIIALHIQPFKEVNDTAHFLLNDVLTRVCVPFFFLTSGFFLANKINDFRKTKAYVFHIVKLYLIYSALYLPQIIYKKIKGGESVARSVFVYVRSFFITGSYEQLWYFVALIVATILLYIMVSKLHFSDKTVFIIVTVLYIIGTIAGAYITDIVENATSGNHPVIWLYFKLFITTRNGFFFGLPFVFWGYLLSKHKEKITKKNYFIYAAIALVAMAAEAYALRTYLGCEKMDMTFTSPIVAVLLFLGICFVSGKDKHKEAALNCRRTSVLLFGMHLFFSFYIETIYLSIFKTEISKILLFVIVAVLNLAVALLLVRLSEKKKLKILKNLY